MLVPSIPQSRRRRARLKHTSTTGPAALTLLSAVYNDDEDPILTLTFDRPINLAGLVATAIVVDDAQQRYLLFNATGGAELLDPATVRFTLVSVGDSIGPGELLTAAANNGIVAVDDGAAWAGVTNLALPYP